MKQHIKVKAALEKNNKWVAVQILEQSHRATKFGNSIYDNIVGEFVYKDAILRSCDCPAFYSYGADKGGQLYLRGRMPDQDDRIVRLTLKQWAAVKEAIKAYNEWGASL